MPADTESLFRSVNSEPKLLYLHGFLSSPESTKAQLTISYCEGNGWAGRYQVPYLRHGPEQTARELDQIIASMGSERLGLIGSSLGGFYATYLGERYQCPAVLVNPAVRPFDLWQDHLGRHENYYSGDIHEVRPEHIDELIALDVPKPERPEDFMVLLETGDETLDYRQAAEKFAEANLVVHQGGSHSYDRYEQELPLLFEFLESRLSV